MKLTQLSPVQYWFIKMVRTEFMHKCVDWCHEWLIVIVKKWFLYKMGLRNEIEITSVKWSFEFWDWCQVTDDGVKWGNL
jgi:hypothetical protein